MMQNYLLNQGGEQSWDKKFFEVVFLVYGVWSVDASNGEGKKRFG
jgi:hypothetical protein